MVSFVDPARPLTQSLVTGRAGSEPGRRFRAALHPAPPEAAQEQGAPHLYMGHVGISSSSREQTRGEEHNSANLSELSDLWDQLVSTIHAGSRLSAEQWTLKVRLDEASYPSTLLELSCMFGNLSVVFRTSSEAVHACLVAQMRQLNDRLKRHAATSDAIVELVSPEELGS